MSWSSISVSADETRDGRAVTTKRRLNNEIACKCTDKCRAQGEGHLQWQFRERYGKDSKDCVSEGDAGRHQ